MATPRERLEGLLGIEVPASWDELDDAQLSLVAEAAGHTLAERTRELDAATAEGLRFVPRLLRPAVRKVLGL